MARALDLAEARVSGMSPWRPRSRPRPLLPEAPSKSQAHGSASARVTPRTAAAGVAVAVAAAAIIYLGGPSFFVRGLPLALAALLLRSSSLALRRSTAACVACALGLAALLIPIVQFALQS